MNETISNLCGRFNEKFSKDRVLIFKDEVLPLNCIAVNERSEILYVDVDLSIYLVTGSYIKQLYCDLIHSHRQSLIVNEVKFNEGGDLFFVRCERSVYVYKLPDSDVNDNVCPGFCVGVNYEFSKPGVYVEKVAWHPLSAHHLVVLTSDNCVRMFNLAKSHQHAEQTYRFPFSFLSKKGGSRKIPKRAITSFAFGKSKSWEVFTLFCVHRNGSLFGICPFVPYGCLIHRSFFNRLRIDDKGKEYLKKITMIKKNDEFVLTKAPSVDDQPRHIFRLKLVQAADFKRSADEEEGEEKEEAEKSSSEEESSYRCSDMHVLTDTSQTYSSISVVFEDGIVKTFVMLEDAHPFCDGIEYICHSEVDMGLPIQGTRHGRPIFSRFKSDPWPPYFHPHPLKGQGFLVVHVSGVHEFKFPFLNRIQEENESESRRKQQQQGESGTTRGVPDINNFSFSKIVQTVTPLNRDNEPIPLKGIAMLPNAFRAFQLLLIDERNRMKSFLLKDFHLAEPDLLLLDVGKQVKSSSSSDEKKKKKKKKKGEEETEGEDEAEEEEEEEEEVVDGGKSELIGRLVSHGFARKMRKLQKKFRRVPKVLSIMDGLQPTEMNLQIKKMMDKFEVSHFAYCNSLKSLIAEHVKHQINLQNVQVKDFHKMQEELKKQMVTIQNQRNSVKRIQEKQIEMEVIKERVLVKMEKVRPISIQEKSFIQFIQKKAHKMPKLKGRIESLSEKSQVYVGRQDRKKHFEDDEKNLFFDVNSIRNKMDQAYKDMKLAVGQLEKLENELKDFKLAFQ